MGQEGPVAGQGEGGRLGPQREVLCVIECNLHLQHD